MTMRSQHTRREFLGLGLGALAVGATGVCGTAAAAAPVFALEDQFERKHTQLTVFARTPVVLVGGDKRATGERIGEWFARLGAGLALYGIADLDSVPFFVPRGAIRSNLREVARRPVLLDWKGQVYRPLLGFPAGQEVVVQVHGADGRLIARTVGPVTPAGIAAVRRAAGVL